MERPKIAIPSFPGSNGEVDNLRALRRCGFEAFVFRWNDSLEKLSDVDGYFFGAGFSYEDRGRAGMVAARDPLFEFIGKEAEEGKVVIGNCNGAQVLVESGLIPLGAGLHMSLAKNAIRDSGSGSGSEQWLAPGFLNQWVYITRTCRRDRCCTSDWQGVMQIPIAHGEGRFVTTDPGLIETLEANDQIAFCYCDSDGNVSEDPAITPNGSTKGIAGICNPAGNVVALMPHPERTRNGDPYFLSVKRRLEKKRELRIAKFAAPLLTTKYQILARQAKPVEIFIDTIIVNNEERTVEQAARRISSNLKLKQFRYLAPGKKAEEVLRHIAIFNPNKERAYVRQSSKFEVRSSKWLRWDAEKKQLVATDRSPLPSERRGRAGTAHSLLRRDIPDTGALGLGHGAETGICYSLERLKESDLQNPKLLEIFANPHASILERLT